MEDLVLQPQVVSWLCVVFFCLWFVPNLFLSTSLGSYVDPFAFGFLCAHVRLGWLTPLCVVAQCLPELMGADCFCCVLSVLVCITPALCPVLLPSLTPPSPRPELLCLHFLSVLVSPVTTVHGKRYSLLDT